MILCIHRNWEDSSSWFLPSLCWNLSLLEYASLRIVMEHFHDFLVELQLFWSHSSFSFDYGYLWRVHHILGDLLRNLVAAWTWRNLRILEMSFLSYFQREYHRNLSILTYQMEFSRLLNLVGIEDFPSEVLRILDFVHLLVADFELQMNFQNWILL